MRQGTLYVYNVSLLHSISPQNKENKKAINNKKKASKSKWNSLKPPDGQGRCFYLLQESSQNWRILFTTKLCHEILTSQFIQMSETVTHIDVFYKTSQTSDSPLPNSGQKFRFFVLFYRISFHYQYYLLSFSLGIPMQRERYSLNRKDVSIWLLCML